MQSTFDVSGVATGNIPEPDCRYRGGISRQDCGAYKRFPDLHLAGWLEVFNYPLERHVQVKTEPGQGVAAIAATRAALREWRDYPGDEWVFIYPVKYDYGEYWRWSVILDRFIHSPGNTLGIVGAFVEYNVVSRGSTIRSASGLQAVQNMRAEPELMRITLNIMTVEPEITLSGLPRLLGQLGIPNDAVGIVREVVNQPRYQMEVHSTARNQGVASEPVNDPVPASAPSEPIAGDHVEIAANNPAAAADVDDAPPVNLLVANEPVVTAPVAINIGLIAALMLPLLAGFAFIGHRKLRGPAKSLRK